MRSRFFSTARAMVHFKAPVTALARIQPVKAAVKVEEIELKAGRKLVGALKSKLIDDRFVLMHTPQILNEPEVAKWLGKQVGLFRVHENTSAFKAVTGKTDENQFSCLVDYSDVEGVKVLDVDAPSPSRKQFNRN
jgi:hypothetical protein